MNALCQLKIPINVVGVVAIAENAIDSLSLKPHTIIQTTKGSVEISNTDAEGRLALADAFTYVQKHYKPTRVIDLATLTGAIIMALGHHTAGIFGNNDDFVDLAVKSGR